MRMRAVPGVGVGLGWEGVIWRVSGGPKDEMRIAFMVWEDDIMVPRMCRCWFILDLVQS